MQAIHHPAGEGATGLSTRIQVVRGSQTVSMYPGPSLAPPSPSSSLLVETQQLMDVGWLTHRIPSYVITMFLNPCDVLHSDAGGPVSRFDFRANTVALCAHGDEESVHWSAGSDVISVGLDPARVANAVAELVPHGRFEMLPLVDGHAPQLATMLHALHAEQSTGYASGRLFVDGMELAIAALLATRQNSRVGRVAVPRGRLTPHCMKSVVDYIDMHLDTALALSDLARCAGLSEGHFSRLFRASFDATPHQYVLRQRIARARHLLATAPFPVLEVGMMCGFANPQHFARVFNQLVGLPPSAFRAACH